MPSTSHPDHIQNDRAPLTALLDDVDERMNVRNTYPGLQGLPTGIGPVDEKLTDELMAGTLTVIAGATGSGKTTLASQLALAFATQTHVLALTLEDRPQDLVYRWLAQISRESISDIRSGFSRKRPGDGLPGTVTTASEQLQRLNLKVPDMPISAPTQIARTVHKWTKQTGAAHGVIIVDQLSELSDVHPSDWPSDWKQLPAPPPGRALECDKLEWKAHFLRELGRVTGCAVVLLAQLNNERNERGRPTVDSLRGSKGIGHKADNVWLLHRTEDRGNGNYLCEFIVAKARQAPTFEVELIFDGVQQRFRGINENPASPWEPMAGPDAHTVEGRVKWAELEARLGKAAGVAPVRRDAA